MDVVVPQHFNREAYFYTHTAPHVPIQAPKCFLGWADPVTETDTMLLEDSLRH